MPPPSLAMPRRVVTDDVRRLHVHVLIALSVLLGAEALGLAFGWVRLSRVNPAWPEIYPYTVAGAAALVASMALVRRGGRAATWVARGLAGITLLLGAGVDLAVNAGLLPSSDPAGGASSVWITSLPSVAATATAAATLLIGFGGAAVARTRFWLAAAAGVISLLVILSYVYGSDLLFLGLGSTGTSLPAAIVGLLTVIAVMSARPDQPPLVSLDQRYDRGFLRRTVPLLVVAPFIPAVVEWAVGSLVTDRAAASAISQLVTVVLLITVISIMGGAQSRARRDLTTQRQRVWDAFEHTPAATAVVAVDGRIVTANEAMARLTQRPSHDLVGLFVSDLIADPDHMKVAEALGEVAAGRDGFRRDVRFRGPTSVNTWVDLNAAPVRDAGGSVTYIILQCADLTDRKHLERILADQATRDGLTGLLNREGLQRQVATLRGVREAGEDVVVVYADVDDLKLVNDTAGHAAGDDLLREVARRLRAGTRGEDIIARVGGDEFVVVTTVPASGPDPAGVVVSRLRSDLSGPVAVGDDIVPLSVSLGATTLEAYADAESALSRADAAMYADKQLRRRASDAQH